MRTLSLLNRKEEMTMIWSAELYGNYRNLKFTDVWGNVSSFVEDCTDSALPMNFNNELSLSTIFYLLYARYGNSVIASSDINQFKYKVYSTIFQYGPTWEKRLEIQKELREASIADLQTGSKQIYNHAYNPSTAPTTDTLDEITYINDQNVTKSKKGLLDTYAFLYNMLETDVTGEFVDKFRKLFLVVVAPEEPLWYTTEGNSPEGEI